MNGQMPPANCGGGGTAARRPSRSSGTVPSAIGLVSGIEADSRGGGTNEKRRRMMRRPPIVTFGQSAADCVGSLAVLAFEGLDLRPAFLINAPLMNPRTLWACQSVAFMIAVLRGRRPMIREKTK
jgi:hypothetical protein